MTHLLLGPYSTGQRDFLLSIFAVAGAFVSARAAEDHRHRCVYLLLAGAFAMTAALIKPTAILLLVLPVFADAVLRLLDRPVSEADLESCAPSSLPAPPRPEARGPRVCSCSASMRSSSRFPQDSCDA